MLGKGEKGETQVHGWADGVVVGEKMSAEKIRILIVDDIAETRENVRKMLQFEYDVDVAGTARSGKEAIQLAQDLSPDVILMDINMPDIDGITATEEIRKRLPHVQVVILSVQGDSNYMMRAMLAGARDFLTKPPMGDELISAVRRAGEMAHAERAKGVKSLFNEKETIDLLLFKEKGLQLTAFELASRLDLYQESLVDGKLVDEIESLVAGLAHDIRSPINIILSILSTINSAEESTLNAVKKIWRRSLYCKWVADNFLGISLSEKISIGNHSLKAIVTEMIDLLESRIHPGTVLSNNIDDTVLAYVDPWLLQLVLLNLFMNSLESMPENGKISINVDSLKDNIAIFVEDNGTPILAKDVRNLFRLGYTTKKSHAGIGLYVSKRLLRQQNGDLYFARDFHSSSKLFGILLPNQETSKAYSNDPRKIAQRISLLEMTIKNTREEIAQFRNQSAVETQQEAFSNEFQRLTTTFSKNLSNELLLIEATVLDAIKKLPSKDKATEKSFRKIIQNCSYCRLLTNNILALGEGASPEVEDLSLIDILEEVLVLVDRKMPSYLYKIDWDIDPLIPNIKADALQMKQVFMNLIKNALDAMPNGGTLQIKIAFDKSFIVVDIGDTGIGISPENISRLFQLGFTTKPKGYGIGLFSIKKIIERHNGEIKVSSVLHRGTIFKIKLPLDIKEAK